MPYIDSKVNLKVTKSQVEVLKAKLGKAIEIFPGKSETWLMLGFQDEYTLYFKGDCTQKLAFIEVKIFGTASKGAYDKMTAELSNIYNEVLGIPKDGIYIKYEEISNWGWNGQNF